jgi:type VII secretion integral membrane protein EccD
VGSGLAGALVLLALGVSLASGPPWTEAALLCLTIAAGCLAGGAVLARMPGDHGVAGLVLGALAQPAAFTGGLLLLGGDEPLGRLGAPHLLMGCLAVLVASLVGQAAVPRQRWLFTAATVSSAAGGLASAIALTPLDGPQTAAISTSVLLIALPIWPTLATRIGRMPLPATPRTAADLVRDDPLPPAAVTFAAVARADVVLTGLLIGGSLIAAIGLVLLSMADGSSGPILTAVAGTAFLLRARLFPAVRHRLPLVLCGATGMAALAVTTSGAILGGQSLWSVPALAVLGAAAVVLGVRYHQGRPSVYLARTAELLEVILLLSVAPLACGVLGLYAVVRGVAG